MFYQVMKYDMVNLDHIKRIYVIEADGDETIPRLILIGTDDFRHAIPCVNDEDAYRRYDELFDVLNYGIKLEGDE